MTDTTTTTTPPSTAEIAALTARLHTLSDAGDAADPAERTRFLADKDRLMDRISAASSRAEPRPPLRGRDNQRAAAAADAALDDAVAARAEMGGYALVGPSSRTWRTDPDTGRLLEPVAEAEHRTLRRSLAAEAVTTTEPAWTDTPDGQDIVSAVIPLADEPGHSTDTSSGELAEFGMTGAEGPPIDAGPALSAEDAAHKLAADGRPIDEARALVLGYLDDVSRRVGTSVHLWGLDGADLAAIRADPLDRARAALDVHNAATAEGSAGADESPADADEAVDGDLADDGRSR
jgi:hypothetical protein